MERKRSQERIIHDILQQAMFGICISHIVYKANLNFAIVRTYLKKIISANLLTKEGKTFTTTPKGINYIQSYQNLQNIMGGE